MFFCVCAFYNALLGGEKTKLLRKSTEHCARGRRGVRRRDREIETWRVDKNARGVVSGTRSPYGYMRVVCQYTNLAAARSPGRDECVAEVLQADKRVVELPTTAAHLVISKGLGASGWVTCSLEG